MTDGFIWKLNRKELLYVSLADAKEKKNIQRFLISAFNNFLSKRKRNMTGIGTSKLRIVFA